MLVIEGDSVWLAPREETTRNIDQLDPDRKRPSWIEALIWIRQYTDKDGSILFEIPRADFSGRQIRQFEAHLRRKRRLEKG